MLKKVLAKAVTGTLLAAGILVPASVLGGADLALMAKKTGCPYDVNQTTTTSLTTNQTQIQAGSAASGTAQVSGPGTLPNGTLTVTAYPYTGSAYSTSGTVVATKAVTNSDRTLNYSNSTLPGNNTYKFEAKYTTPDCDYSDSTSTPKYVSVYKYNTTTSKSSTSTQFSATVTPSTTRSPDSTVALPTGIVTFTYFKNNNSTETTTGTVTQATGVATASIPANARSTDPLLSAQYGGDSFYNSSTG